jgi:hypothetical protein
MAEVRSTAPCGQMLIQPASGAHGEHDAEQESTIGAG